jgi:hypothetical protein
MGGLVTTSTDRGDGRWLVATNEANPYFRLAAAAGGRWLMEAAMPYAATATGSFNLMPYAAMQFRSIGDFEFQFDLWTPAYLGVTTATVYNMIQW